MNTSYTIIRSSRKSISLEITPKGQVLVRCPRRMPTEEVRRFVTGKASWIEKHLNALSPVPSPLTEEEIRDLIRRAKEYIPQRAAYFAPKVGVTYNRITIRSQRTRWGSCSSKGNLNFNCLLMLAPPEVLDYVVVHELCHRKEMNHSGKFWAEVERVLPDYPLRRKWLTDRGSALMVRLPGK